MVVRRVRDAERDVDDVRDRRVSAVDHVDAAPVLLPHDRREAEQMACGAAVRILTEAGRRQARAVVDAHAGDRKEPFLKRAVHLVRIELRDDRRGVLAVHRFADTLLEVRGVLAVDADLRNRHQRLNDLILLVRRDPVRNAEDRDRREVLNEQFAFRVENLAALGVVDADQQLVAPLHRREDQRRRPHDAPLAVLEARVDRVVVGHLAERLGVVGHCKIDRAGDRRVGDVADRIADVGQTDRVEDLRVLVRKLLGGDHRIARLGLAAGRVLDRRRQKIVCSAVAALADVFQKCTAHLAAVSVRGGTAERCEHRQRHT